MTDLAKIDLPFVKAYRDRHGKMRHYLRRRGYRPVALKGEPGSVEFARSYQAALAAGKQVGVSLTEGPRSMGALIAEFYRSGPFLALSPLSQRTYRNQLERFREEFGRDDVENFTAVHLNAIFHRQAATPAQTANLRKRLRQVFTLGVDLGWIDSNPVISSKRVAYKAKGHTPWPDEAIQGFLDFYPAGSRERRAMMLLRWTGVRRSDVVTLGRQHLKDGKISVLQEKTDKRVWLLVHPELKAELDLALADSLTFLLTEYGAPFTGPGFTHWFGRAADKVPGCKGLRPHGVRKALGRQFAEGGATEEEIMGALGQTNPASAATYTKDANRNRLAEGAHAKLWKVEG